MVGYISLSLGQSKQQNSLKNNENNLAKQLKKLRESKGQHAPNKFRIYDFGDSDEYYYDQSWEFAASHYDAVVVEKGKDGKLKLNREVEIKIKKKSYLVFKIPHFSSYSYDFYDEH